MDLFELFKSFILKERLFAPADRLLVAVSGGLDSMVLTELCHRAGLDFMIVHCNFQLRGAESQRDEEFVWQQAARYGREVRVGRFDTAVYAASNKVSVQVAARQLRYQWFETLLHGGPARFVLTAHQLDDNIETMVMNFFKGTGIAGLRGMLPKQGHVVRPLLFASRVQLTEFAAEAGLSWVEDSSNQSDKYTRNYFRHQVLPLIEQAYPGALSNLADNLGRFREIENVYRHSIDLRLQKLLEYKGNEVHIPVEKLRKLSPLATLLFEIVKPYGFTPQQLDAIIALLDSDSGKYVLSAACTHRLLKNRNWLILSSLGPLEAAHILVEEKDAEIRFRGGVLQFERVGLPAGGAPARGALEPGSRLTAFLDQGPLVALLDASRVVFPLLLRPWRPGDYFYPLGMRKKKKLSRFFIDSKLSIADKERVWVLEMDKKVIWVVGLRIDDRWKVGPGTTAVLRIECEQIVRFVGS
jgi:tRNA(Ile)-lysidine synthase